jgi:hypothetical protein
LALTPLAVERSAGWYALKQTFAARRPVQKPDTEVFFQLSDRR